ncbi:MAG: hypothetical protein ACYTBP_14790 [Planctomycetota bacterium]|jgi:hypothetical protein
MKLLYHVKVFLVMSVILSAVSAVQGGYTQMGRIITKKEAGYNITFTCENGKVRVSFALVTK